MPRYHSAFIAGETVRLADASSLKALQKELAGWPAPIPKNMADHADEERVMIRSVSYYHGGKTLYELAVVRRVAEYHDEYVDLPDYWPEEALIDLSFGGNRNDEHGLYSPACETYESCTDVSSGPGIVSICDTSGKVFCQLHRIDAPQTVTDINAVARIRARSSFEARYNFDGLYPSLKHKGMANNRINSDWQIRCAPLPSGYTERYALI